MTRNEWRFGLGLFLVALLVRVAFVHYFIEFDGPIGSHDAALYDMLGWNLASGEGYSLPESIVIWGGSQEERVPTSLQPPGYPVLLAVIYAVFGYGHVTVRLFQCLLSAVTVLLLYLFSRRAFPEAVARVCCVMAVVYPFILTYPGRLMAETLLTFLVVCMTGFLILLDRAPARRSYAVLAGLSLGAAILTKSLFVLYPLFLIAAAGGILPGTTRLKHLGIVLVACVAVLLLWTARNTWVHGQFVALSSYGGFAFAQGNNQWVSEQVGDAFGKRAWGRLPSEDVPEINEALRGSNEAERDRYFYRYGLRYIWDHPFLTLRNLLYKGFYFQFPTDLPHRGTRPIPGWMPKLGYVILPFLLIGLWQAIRVRSRLPNALLISLMACGTFNIMMFRFDIRYRGAFEPFVLLLAAIGMVGSYDVLVAAWRQRRRAVPAKAEVP